MIFVNPTKDNEKRLKLLRRFDKELAKRELLRMLLVF